jgi:F420-non-reducing hydrogenase iron-sulfur subunit
MAADNKRQARILLITSADSAYVGADTVGQGHMNYPANTFVMKIVAPSLLPEAFFLYCFKKGIDGIIVMSSGEESPYEGTQHRLTARLDKLVKKMKGMEIDIRRLKLCAICTVCTASFLREVNNMNTILDEIGPVDPQKVMLESSPSGQAGGQV